jgi:integrase
LTSTEASTAYTEYQKALNHYNRALKTLAAKSGISHALTSYMSRHSWASIAYDKNVDLSVISKALGHANPQHTLIYIKQINDSRLEEANHKILECIRIDD